MFRVFFNFLFWPGVEELLPPRIPSVFVHAEQGQQLLRNQRSRATVAKADGASSVVGYWVMMVESMVKNGYTVVTIHCFFGFLRVIFCWGCNVSGIAMPWRTATWEWFWPFYGIGVYDWVFCITCAWLWSNLELFWWTTIYFCSSSYSKPFKLGLIIWRATTWAYCRFAGWV